MDCAGSGESTDHIAKIYWVSKAGVGKQAGVGEGEAQTTLKGNQDHGGTTWQLLEQ